MAIGDIYQIKMFQQYIGQSALNVFYYQETAGVGGSSAELQDEFLAEVWTKVCLAQSIDCVTNRITVINGSDNFDFVDVFLSLAGAQTTEKNFPPSVAIGYRSGSGGPGTRYGYKRFPGVRSSIIDPTNDGEFSSALAATLFRDIGVVLGSVLTATAGTYLPVLVKGGFKLGIVPITSRAVGGQWLLNVFPTNQRTRQNYDWQLS